MGPAGHIKSIKIGAGGVIDSVAFAYVFEGTTYETLRHGGSGGGLNAACNVLLPSKLQIKFFDEEYLNAISGCIGEYDGTPCISQLTFTTNMGTLPVDEGKIAGFYGRAGTYLIAIGAYLKPN
ncbi:Mannose glucose-specific lectin [Musa troglodytarum]|uniref:Mannose glucose-specific lectin n=1 Tax=Musa troglodytarum TaxID=320322 RepID=A0A9E7HLF1_9LILI|nr:Mannose glucose-specific lectin [Musa troglodytarum]